MIGKMLGHYQITSQLGKGGMGEVFQAKDQVLGRDVAIKILPDEFAKDADRVARFQREAKLLASLNHHNIAAIYGLEESAGTNFLVLELVEGETLADCIKAGPIPVEESLKLALQIAEALEAAHEKCVIHRDLKPSNIKVTPDGKVKVLDFGLAKAYAGEQAELNLSNSPTLSNMATQQGVILGTAAYMSPEQAKGKTVDRRADVWAFGCVVFEMLTGRSTFSAEDVSQTLARVLERQPDFSALPRDIHPKIAEMLERCLEKDVRNRYSGISDARIDIRKALADPRGLSSGVQAPAARSKLKTIMPWIAAIVVVGAAAGTAVWKLKPSEPRQLFRFDYDLPEGRQFKDAGTYPCIAISPDGKQLVYAATGGLYLRSMDALTSRHIEGTEDGAVHPFFSPDGKKIGYYSEAYGKLRRVSINGGVPSDLCNISTLLLGASWGADDRILYSDSRGIMRVAATGGSPESVIQAKNETFFHPRLLPDGKSVLFTVSSPKVYETAVQQIPTGKRKVLFEGDDAFYLPSSHLIFALGNNLWAVPFDSEKNELRGDAVPIIQGVLRDGPPQYAVSPGGILAYLPASSDLPFALAQRTIYWVTHAGKEERIPAPPKAYAFPSISPDGTKLAVSISDGKSVNIWTWDLLRSAFSRLTSGQSVDGFSLWTRNGRRIAFFSADQDKWGIYWKSADGTGEAELLSSLPGRYLLPSSWAHEGKTLVMFGISSQVVGLQIATSTLLGFVSAPGGTVGVSPEMEPNIAMVSVDGERGVKQLLQEKSLVIGKPQVSPDGRWIAYCSNELGQSEIYVRPYPDVNSGKLPISTNGGSNMRWAPEIPSRRLFYSNSEAMMAVDIDPGPALKAGVPKELFKGMNQYSYMWDLSHDGKRFLMIKEPAPEGQPAPESPRKINVVLNFMEELNSRTPE